MYNPGMGYHLNYVPTKRFNWLAVPLLIVFILISFPAFAADPDAEKQAISFVESLYGERISKVQRTRDHDDDVALMGEMLEIAPTLPETPDARSALYVRVVEMAKRSRTGYDKALKALDFLAEHNPGHSSSDQRARLDLYSAWYRVVDQGGRAAVGEDYFQELLVAADTAMGHGELAQARRWYNEAGSVQRVTRVAQDIDLRERLTNLRAVEQMVRESEQLIKTANRGELRPEQARRLVLILALEQGGVQDAVAYGKAVGDKDFQQGLLAAAAFALASTDEQNSDALVRHAYHAGVWYAAMAEEENLSASGKRRAIESARKALRHYLSHTELNNVEKARSTIMLRQLDEQYAEAYGPKVDENDLLAALDPEKHMIGGRPFKVKDGKVVLEESAILRIPAEGGDHYVLDVVAEGDGRSKNGLMIWLPVHGQTARLIVDGSTHHRTLVEGLSAIENSEEKMMVLPGKPIELRIEVRQLKDDQVSFRLWHSGEQVWAWRGGVDELTPPKYGAPPNKKHFAIAGASGLTIERARLHRYSEGE